MPLRLYDFDLSPFAARCRFVIYAKGIPVEIVPSPEGGPRSAAYLAINPVGKIPALVLEDGTAIPESEVICEYLEDRFPHPALLPASPEDRARARLVGRLSDLYLWPPLMRLFGQMQPELRDEAAVSAARADVGVALDLLERFVDAGGWAVGRERSLADAALVPSLFGVRSLLPAFGTPQPLAGRPRLGMYWRRVREDAVVQRLLGEMQAGLERMVGPG